MKKLLTLVLILGAIYSNSVYAAAGGDGLVPLAIPSGTKIKAEMKFAAQPLSQAKYLKLYSGNSDTIYALTPPIINYKGTAVAYVLRVPGFAGQCIEFDPANFGNCLKYEPIGTVTDSVFIKNTRTGAKLASYSFIHDTSLEIDANEFVRRDEGDVDDNISLEYGKLGLTFDDVIAAQIYFLVDPSPYYYNEAGEVPLKRVGTPSYGVVTDRIDDNGNPEPDILSITKPKIDPRFPKAVVYWFYAKGKVYFFYG